MRTFSGTVGPVEQVSTCKICRNDAPLYGVTDFNKTCEEHRGQFLPLTGVAVYYHRCNQCGLVFTNSFDHWSKSDYLKHIYNDDYVTIDPEYLGERASNNAVLVLDFIKKAQKLKCLDYGGGNGRLAEVLRERGVDGVSWDPMDGDEEMPAPGQFDFISAFEVLEHTPEPVATVKQALDMLCGRGVMMFSTLTIDHIAPRSMDNWYIAPRNGHITLYTKQSLQTLFADLGYRVHHFNSGLHLAVRDDPDWLS
jgi:2-polyprenyl-3-methyl-5-hydroxy-6-metoxy-1,4-benzoquinol methylase